ncbi:vWA domain-containing protein [Oceaniglobus roseus]|uniref:vWA domain-containing protein n=1 Tax=Oceaniglobus roseus TaxID=1737570 RepID=UPI000C7F5C2E|nr:VWA domain-containing protein [Kandeliimicrobium roseum]
MTDPLDDLRDAMRRATPAPDSARRAETLARAQESFDRLQESRPGPRPNPVRPGRWADIRNGAGMMLNTLSSRGALAATTALAACVLLVALPSLNLGPTSGPVPPRVPDGTEAMPASADDAAAPMVDAAPPPAPAPQSLAPSAERMSRGLALPPGAAAPKAMPGVVMAEPPALLAEPPVMLPEADTEAFANADPNPVKVAAEDPVSTFSIDTDTASWAVIRQSIMAGALPPKDAVRIEEMVNYFPYAYPAPEADAAFRPVVSLSETPWNPGTRLLRIGLQGALPAVADRPPLNLVFLIDTSGSMQGPDRLGLLVQSFRLMLSQLRPEDEVAIVTYAGSAGLVLPPTLAGERGRILAALDGLTAGGSTAGQDGLRQAYATAEEMAKDGEVSRILLATDGDFNVGPSDPEALKDYVAGKRESGTYLSVLGFGRGNLDDATMQALAQNGNGTAAYIDTLSEAQKVLVDQLTGALFPIADDVKVQVEFNPATVAEYRLIGYETRALLREDFNNDRVDAGEIGAGHQVTALYEVTPKGSPARLTDPLHFGTAPATSDSTDLAFLRLRWKAPGTAESRLSETAIPDTVTAPDDDARFAAAIAGFGQLLRGSAYLGNWGFGDAVALAQGATGEDPYGYRHEAVKLMRLAESMEH